MRNIVVVGCGFAGYHATRRLQQKMTGRRRVQVTVVTDQPHFVFSPLLSAVAGGQLEADRITVDADEAFASRIRVVIARVETIDFDQCRLLTDDQSLPFDYLVLATGSIRDPEAFEGAEHIIGLDTLDDAVAARRRVDELLEDDPSAQRLSVIGGSTTGVEWAGRLATRIHEAGRSSGPNRIDVQLFERRSRLLADHSRRMSSKITDYLQQLGVQVHTDTAVEAASSESVELADGQLRDSSAVFHCAGRVGTSLAQDSSLSVDDSRRIEVRPDLSIDEHSGVFAAGDAITHETTPDSSNPQVAMQQGIWAARNLIADMSGRTRKPFEFDDRGDFVTVGPDRTALELGGLLLEGRAAWLAYRLYYTALMPRSIQKTNVLRDWISRRLSDDAPDRLPDDSD